MKKLNEEVEKWKTKYNKLQISAAKEKEEAPEAAVDENEQGFD